MKNGIGIILLALAWLALTGSFTIPNALLGLALSALGFVLCARAATAQRDRHPSAARSSAGRAFRL